MARRRNEAPIIHRSMRVKGDEAQQVDALRKALHFRYNSDVYRYAIERLYRHVFGESSSSTEENRRQPQE